MSYQAVIRLLGAIPTQGRLSTGSIVERVDLSGKKLEKRSVERGLANLADQPEPPILRACVMVIASAVTTGRGYAPIH